MRLSILLEWKMTSPSKLTTNMQVPPSANGQRADRPKQKDVHSVLLSCDDTSLETRKLPLRLEKPVLPDEIGMSQRLIVTRDGFFEVMRQIAQNSDPNRDRKRFYFRGEACSDFTLHPSLLRDGVYSRLKEQHGASSPIELQKKLLDRFRRYTQHLIHSDNDFNAPIWDDFDTLCLAQHHSLPTLLMDWTLNPYVAAYFALSEAYKTRVREKLAAYPSITKYWVRVWVMRLRPPSERSKLTVHLEDRKQTWEKSLGDVLMAPTLPLIVVPLVFTRRIAAQAGRFVYCGYMTKDAHDKDSHDDGGSDGAPACDSLAMYSHRVYEASAERERSKNLPSVRQKIRDRLAWDQLYSLDIEFDISEDGTEEHGDHRQAFKIDDPQRKLMIFQRQIMKMMSDLEFIGFHAGRLFPDLEGWARYLAEGNL
jgi:FRG domain